MAELLVECRRCVQFVELSVHLDPLETLLAKFEKFLAVLALSIPHDWSQKIAARPLFHLHDTVHHVLHLLRFNRQTSRRAVRRAGPCKKQSEIVVNFGDRAHGRSRIFGRGLLFNRDGRRQPRNVVHIRLFHHVEELPRIGAQALDITALTLGIDRVKCQRGLARARQAGDHDQLITRNIHVDAFQVVLARAAHLDMLQLGHQITFSRANQRDSGSDARLNGLIRTLPEH